MHKPKRILFFLFFPYIITFIDKFTGGGTLDIGKKLHRIREERNFSVYRLTQLTGVSGHHIKGIEEGIRQPTIDTLERLVTALGSTLVDFFNDNEECTYLSENEKKLIDNYRNMTESKAQAFLIMSEALNE